LAPGEKPKDPVVDLEGSATGFSIFEQDQSFGAINNFFHRGGVAIRFLFGYNGGVRWETEHRFG
jgi:hypothetical protein